MANKKSPAPAKKKSTRTTKTDGQGQALMSWMGGDEGKPVRKRSRKVPDKQTLSGGLNKLFTSFNSETPKPSASDVTESSNPQEESNKHAVSKEGYEVVSHIQSMARKKGFENPYQLWQKIGGSKESAAQLWRGDFKMVGIPTLKKLCEVLGCGVGDLLVFEPSTASHTS